jgi:hypothetical protein
MKKFIFLGIVAIIIVGVLAVNAEPASAIVEYCFDPDDGPEVCYYDYTPEEYCELYLPVYEAPLGSNPEAEWNEENQRCYFRYDNATCDPAHNMLGDFYKIYTSNGVFQDEIGRYVWQNGVSGCALKTGVGYRLPALIRIEDGGIGSAKIRMGEFNYEYGTCSGLCRISTTKMTIQATRGLEELPYKTVYKKAFVTILNAQKELAQGTFRLCYKINYNEKRNPAYFRFNGTDWTYYGGFWNVDFSKFCMYSQISGNYVLAEMGPN